MEETKTQTKIMGGGFLMNLPEGYKSFTPEDYTEEQEMLRSSIRGFLDLEIEPNKEIFDTVEGTKLAPSKLEKLGELGYLSLSVPEKFGGYGCDIKTDLAASEVMSDSFSFSQSLGIQRGLGINTILFYGNPAQQEKYLEGIITGKIKCSYCLTEPGAGSDANSGKTKATYSEDGKHFILNGQKMWITNAGFADVFSVFCKIDDDPNLSCLIVEKEWGVTLGEEEKKLGIHGSSTRQVYFEDVKVPVENLLGERNQGFKIAMNALNIGRLMIGVAGSAISKRSFGLGINYANQRVQFGKAITSFGAIQEKISKMATEIFALESAWNRLGGDMDTVLNQELESGLDILTAKQKVAAEFAAECAIIKIRGSETESYVVDESLQMHGGMGFSAESEISIHYKNIRGNRIYEGTNEINRLVISGTIFRRGFKGELPLMEEIMRTFSKLTSGQLSPIEDGLRDVTSMFNYISNVKKATLLSLGLAAKKYQAEIKEKQQLLSRLSDIMSHLYFMESIALRCEKNGSEIQLDMTQLYLLEKQPLITQAIREVVCHCTESERAKKDLTAILSLIALPEVDIMKLRKKIASHFISKNSYSL